MFINETIRNLSHIDDIKVTYSNGFHVSTAITKTLKINVNENCFNVNY
jgi:hypothetical protein